MADRRNGKMNRFMKCTVHLLAAILSGLLLVQCTTQSIRPEGGEMPAAVAQSIIRVSVTSQGYHFHRPWQQRRPNQQTAIGAILPGGRVLVTALLVANHRYIELETIDSRLKQRAEVEVVDYEANLALLKPVDAAFLNNSRPLSMASPSTEGDRLTILQVKPDGDVVPSTGDITSIELSAYTQGNHFLTYRLNGSLQYRFGNVTLPVLNGSRLAGLLLRNNGSQTVDIIPAPVIHHFLEDANSGDYAGFPMAGFHYGPALDPQLRRYIGLPDDQSGIYVQKIIKGGPADVAGLQAGDVITRMGTHSVSNTGQYNHPLYGKTSLVHLIRTAYQVGDTIPLTVFRKGKTLTLSATLDHRAPQEYLVPPFIIDRQPQYRIVGGLVFQELSLSYLREYGKDWTRAAPIHLLYLSQNQDYRNGDDREKIVIITQVIPTPYTIGYENLSNLVVSRVNGQSIGKLADLEPALETPVQGFHKIEVEQSPGLLYLDPAELPSIHDTIETRYRIPISSAPAAF
jgi:hypothetical protein